ncbi:hypothetical protein N0824_03256 [Microcystis sp. 0824]|nr:hypothetical protein N0824_03256 [Microcystis sp. 0824]
MVSYEVFLLGSQESAFIYSPCSWPPRPPLPNRHLQKL